MLEFTIGILCSIELWKLEFYWAFEFMRFFLFFYRDSCKWCSYCNFNCRFSVFILHTGKWVLLIFFWNNLIFRRNIQALMNTQNCKMFSGTFFPQFLQKHEQKRFKWKNNLLFNIAHSSASVFCHQLNTHSTAHGFSFAIENNFSFCNFKY